MIQRGRGGFSLMELMVVIAVIGALLALGLPAVQRMRQSARAMECKNNLKQMAVALQNHQSEYGSLPKNGVHGWGYATYLLPQVGQSSLFQTINPGQNTLTSGASVQIGVTDTVIPTYICPAFLKTPRISTKYGRLSFLGNSGMLNKKKMSLADVTDGESTTIAFAETVSDYSWARSATSASSTPQSQHGDGANFAMCDGAVRWINGNVSTTVIQALYTISSNDVVGEF